jgi:hypothetical protein
MNKKIMAIVIIIIIAVGTVGVIVWHLGLFQTGQPAANANLPPLELTVVGATGDQVTLNETSMASLPQIESCGGFKSSGGVISDVGNYTGVSVLSLCDLVGGMPSDASLTVIASDGYSMVFTYNQVNGHDFTTYDQITGSEKAATQSLTLVVNYFHNSTVIPSDVGPLRMGIVGPEGLLTEGHFWVKMVSRIEVTANVRDWRVLVNATSPLYMDRQALTADLNHFGVNYTDTSNNVWTGTALWRWVSWSNYNGGVTNASLDAGYSVKIISGDGSSAVFDDSEVKNNDTIIVAAELNGAILPDPYWPLTMVGSGVSASKQVKNIVTMQIILDQPENVTVTPVTDWTLTVNGTAAVSMSRTAYESQVASVSMSWTDSSNNNWTGTPLHRLVVWGTSNGAISSDALTSGYVVKIIGRDGTTIAMNDSRINMNSNIFVAYLKNSAVPSGNDWPLTLAGSGIAQNEMVRGIAQIQILPLQHLNLTVVGNGHQLTLFSNDLVVLASYTANGGTRSSAGTLANYGSYTGVPILTLCNLVGGLTSSNTVKVTASDGYTTTYTYAQLSGQGIATYDSAGNSVTPTQPMTMIVAYFYNGANLASGLGPLRTITVGPEGYYTTGSTSSKLVVEIDIL